MPSGWSTTRKHYLADHPLCEWPGCRRTATTVDHILARAFDGKEANSLLSLCPIHAAIKDRDDQRRGKARAKAKRQSEPRGEGSRR